MDVQLSAEITTGNMKTEGKKTIIVQVTINAPVERVWKNWISPDDIVKWNYASAEWHTPEAKNDLRIGGRFLYRMEAKDGSSGFDFAGVYSEVKPDELIEYTLGDNRKVKVVFAARENKTDVIETFEAEDINPVEQQRAGWLSILNNFKRHVESDRQ